ncbi:hypothetical protein CHH49_16615 [Terribacillus saccharophilus]|uniref:hypothetical protein n=1 Tax=Terribacillus saccharophilus TaxID=361277 RepID=UPI000BA7D245|nr:hypothetical protein [Terribacillus saccharophilus]PAF20399.1 hypothetical protein CHH49_16615 [Terribacillus saccharophilus]
MNKFKMMSLITFITTIILLGGCVVKDNIDKETASDIKEIAINYIENNYKSVESIKLEEPYRGQMGSLKVDGTVNEIGFSISFNEDLTFKGISTEEKFPERKDECKDTSCEY